MWQKMGHIARRSLRNLTKYINLSLIEQHLVQSRRLRRAMCPIFCHILVTVRCWWIIEKTLSHTIYEWFLRSGLWGYNYVNCGCIKIASICSYICSLQITCWNLGTSGPFLRNAPEILGEPSCFCENFEDNHWEVLKIMEKSSFILLSKDFIIQIDRWP